MQIIRMILALQLCCAAVLGEPLDFWTRNLRETNQISAAWSGGVYAEGKFVVGGQGVLVSRDGEHWSRSLQDPVRNVVFGNGVFLAASKSGDKFHASNDAETWITRRSVLSSPQVLFFGGAFLMAAERTIASSVDGLDWVISTTNAPNLSPFFVCEGKLFGGGFTPMVSEDGVTFSPATSFPPFSSIASMGGTYVTLDIPEGGSNHKIRISPDGTNWATITPHQKIALGSTLSTVGGRFVIPTGAEWFLESTDGTNWTDHQVVMGSTNRFNHFVSDGARFIAFGRIQIDSPKPGSTFLDVYTSRSTLPSAPAAISISLVPALTLSEGFVGSPYRVEFLGEGLPEWQFLRRVIPDRFPYVVTDPDGLLTNRLYRVVAD